MLSLPEQWQSLTGGAVAAYLYAQLPQDALQCEIAGSLTAACLDLAAAGISLRGHAPPVVRSLPGLSWQIGGYIYVFFPRIDNESLARAIELGSRAFYGSIVVPPDHEEVLWRACQASLGNRTPLIQALDSFVDLRTLFSSADFNWPVERVVLDVLRRYNRRALDEKRDERILVNIPSEAPRPP